MTGPIENQGTPPTAPTGFGASDSGSVEIPQIPQRFHFEGVALVGRTESGPSIVDGLSLALDADGITIMGPGPETRRTVLWSVVSAASCGTPGATPSGRTATPLDLTSSHRTVRFFLYGDRVRDADIRSLIGLLPTWVGSAPPWQSPPPPVHATLPPPPVHATLPPPPVPATLPLPLPFAPPPPPLYYPYPVGGQFPVPYPMVNPYAVQYPWGTVPMAPDHPAPRKGRRRAGMLIGAAMILLGAGGLAAFELAGGQTPSVAAHPPTSSRTPDQRLANQVMLTQSDLPVGWLVSPANSGSIGNSPSDRKAQAQFVSNFAQCMGVTADQAASLSGGPAADQTAQMSSPVFEGPSTGSIAPSTAPGQLLELVTNADIVKTHADEVRDFGLFTNPRFPNCEAAMTASLAQLGVNDASGGTDAPGPATATVVNLVAPKGEQVEGITMHFAITANSAHIPVEVDFLIVGSDRIEGQLQTFAVGTQFPGDVLSASVSTFEQRVATQGNSASA
jgi:hypothetical protein